MQPIGIYSSRVAGIDCGGLEDSWPCGHVARRKHLDMAKRAQPEFAAVQHSIRHSALRKGRSTAPDCHGRDHHIIGRRQHFQGRPLRSGNLVPTGTRRHRSGKSRAACRIYAIAKRPLPRDLRPEAGCGRCDNLPGPCWNRSEGPREAESNHCGPSRPGHH